MSELLLKLLSIIAASGSVAAVCDLLLTLIRSWFRGLRESSEEPRSSDKVATDGRSVVDYVIASLQAQSKLHEPVKEKAQRRADLLFRVATALAVLSVCIPFLLVIAYFYLDPVEQVQQFTKLGMKPEQAVSLAARDWHLLIAGLSFGLLFLGAAKAVFSAEAKQREIYFRKAGDISRYDRLLHAVQIAEYIDTREAESSRQLADQAIRRIAVQLIEYGVEPAGTTASSGDSGIDAPEFTKLLGTAFKE